MPDWIQAPPARRWARVAGAAVLVSMIILAALAISVATKPPAIAPRPTPAIKLTNSHILDGPIGPTFAARPTQAIHEMINGLTRSDDSPSDIRITQGLAETTVEIANATKHLNEAIAVGDSTVVLRDVAHGVPGGPPPGTIFLGSTMKPSDFIHGQEVGIVLQIVPKDSQTSAGARTLMFSHNNEVTMIGPGPASDAETKILVTDAGGNMVANYSLPHGTPVYSIHIVNADFQEPLKLTLTMPAPTK